HKWSGEVRQLVEQVKPGDLSGPTTARLADLQERICVSERRATEVREEVLAFSRKIVDQQEVTKAMTVFEPLWESLTPREQTRVIQLLVQCVDYNGSTGKVKITFHPSGIKTLSEGSSEQEDAA
ncbi:MAG: recombinase family protein, partial [Planctomycetes bacterium]|nr:recombinase family protein [Planctomycetota bacterium]